MKNAKAFQIVLAEPFDSDAVTRLEEVGNVSVLEDSSPQTLISAIEKADALLVRSKAHVTARIIEAAPHLKVIGRASSNLDHIDLRAARQRNISIVYAPRVAVTSTAEFVLTIMLTLTRRIFYFDHQLRDGKFDVLRVPTGREMNQMTLGLLGIDPVAERLAEMCAAAFGMTILYHDPAGRSLARSSAQNVGLRQILTDADILSVHLPLTPATRGLLNAQQLALMKPTAILINTSRGPVIDTSALALALRKWQLGGAGLDVFEMEPLPPNHPLRTAPNCILTPHIAGCTLDASAAKFHVAQDVVRVLRGEMPEFSADTEPNLP